MQRWWSRQHKRLSAGNRMANATHACLAPVSPHLHLHHPCRRRPHLHRRPLHAPPSPSPPIGGGLCGTAVLAPNDKCNDGGPAQHKRLLSPTRCGPRLSARLTRPSMPGPSASSPAGSGGGLLCSDACSGFKQDGKCNDGGAASVSSDCQLGTDCSDCGPRSYSFHHHCHRHTRLLVT